MNTDIQFDGVSIAKYEKTGLRNVSFHLSQGSITAIVGPSGSCKTTICSLIARFYDVSDGTVFVGTVFVGTGDVFGGIKGQTIESML